MNMLPDMCFIIQVKKIHIGIEITKPYVIILFAWEKFLLFSIFFHYFPSKILFWGLLFVTYHMQNLFSFKMKKNSCRYLHL